MGLVLNQYGLFAHHKKANFPTRLGLLDDVGLLPRTIIANLNIERNAVEHEYDVPTERRVAEAIDVAKLLLMATERMVEQTPHEVIVG
ncbi:MAG TPA: hypothetical protein VKG64_00320, partial [Methylomirabilota bacterium]|nr:hypothetical protein [Methylomirabilota bacterium]